MAGNEAPGIVTTTVVVVNEHVTNQEILLGRILKGAQIIVPVIAFFCIYYDMNVLAELCDFGMRCGCNGSSGWFLFVTFTAALYSICIPICYLMKLNEKFNLAKVNCKFMEVALNALTAVGLLLGCILVFALCNGEVRGKMMNMTGEAITGGIFGFIGVFVFAIGAFIAFREWQEEKTAMPT